MIPFIGMIIMFGGNFAPRGYAFCDGALLNIASNTALFSILGTTYGGDGRTTFGLPDLSSRGAMHPGSGPGLTTRRLGEKSGTETNTLSELHLPNHNHPATSTLANGVSSEDATSVSNDGSKVLGNTSINIYSDQSPTETMGNAATTLNPTGGGQSVNNMQPYLAVNFIIALIGTYPSRN
jgi:microcystin-dependent protein